MRKILACFAAIVLVVSFVGCATVSMKSKVQHRTISLTDMQGLRVRQFEANQRAIWLFWGLIPLNVPEVDDIVAPYVVDHTGIQNLEVESKYTLLDGLIMVLTDGIITMRTITVEGEVYD